MLQGHDPLIIEKEKRKRKKREADADGKVVLIPLSLHSSLSKHKRKRSFPSTNFYKWKEEEEEEEDSQGAQRQQHCSGRFSVLLYMAASQHRREDFEAFSGYVLQFLQRCTGRKFEPEIQLFVERILDTSVFKKI